MEGPTQHQACPLPHGAGHRHQVLELGLDQVPADDVPSSPYRQPGRAVDRLEHSTTTTPDSCSRRPDQRVQVRGLTCHDGFLNGTGPYLRRRRGPRAAGAGTATARCWPRLCSSRPPVARGSSCPRPRSVRPAQSTRGQHGCSDRSSLPAQSMSLTATRSRKLRQSVRVAGTSDGRRTATRGPVPHRAGGQPVCRHQQEAVKAFTQIGAEPCRACHPAREFGVLE